ncbi:hypothetical protein R2325_16880 [Mycobacteroides chelonae]|uniref:hypothetical protein n=1 Tax=Mycobacteroides chelonae TaxID=1774 RepID=UPI002DF4E516|nr:hypothetical protein [Mycobacteroides chelonae]MEC4871720.1 hypothetical protein [Mycobacteroides chelonae]
MTEKLELTEAVRKAMAARLCLSFNLDDEVGLYEVDRMIAAAKGAPVGTIARRPDGAWIAHRYANLKGERRWNYFRVDYNAPFHSPGDADSWPQIRPDEWPVSRVYSTEEAAEILGVDLTAQQEPGESLSRGLDDPAAGRVSRRDDYLEPQPEPKLCSGCYQCQAPKPPRTPRVVDRLGVEHQGSRWRDRQGSEWKRDGDSWRYLELVLTRFPGGEWVMAEPSTEYGPYTEVIV